MRRTLARPMRCPRIPRRGGRRWRREEFVGILHVEAGAVVRDENSHSALPVFASRDFDFSGAGAGGKYLSALEIRLTHNLLEHGVVPGGRSQRPMSQAMLRPGNRGSFLDDFVDERPDLTGAKRISIRPMRRKRAGRR